MSNELNETGKQIINTMDQMIARLTARIDEDLRMKLAKKIEDKVEWLSTDPNDAHAVEALVRAYAMLRNVQILEQSTAEVRLNRALEVVVRSLLRPSRA